jgi:N-acetylmuramoyl-L-alanine amidase CwlA
MHYTDHPGQTPIGAWRYFNDPTKSRYAGIHYCVGMDGEVYEFTDPERVVWHAGAEEYTDWWTQHCPRWAKNQPCRTPNWICIGIEVCHPDPTGKWTEKGEKSAALLAKHLLKRYNLGVSNVIRHYDVTGKLCPKWYVERPEEWHRFKGMLR